MHNKTTLMTILLFISHNFIFAQNYSFNFNTTGRRVCLVSSEIDLNSYSVKIIFHDSLSNTTEPIYINRRLFGTYSWTNVASALPPGTGHWIDTNVAHGEIWEYQVKRQNTWNFQSSNYDATGYTIGCLQSDHTRYNGQMILLVAEDISTQVAAQYIRLKKEITADGWLVNELIVPRAADWDSGSEVVTIKNQITSIYNNAPPNDKPKALFILGHVPLPRCGSTNVVAPDDHNENKGARGCDAYYADIDGVFTDTATYNPGGLATNLAINLPGDFKWDQDFFPSDIEMAFGRIDFAGLTEISTDEHTVVGNYLDRLSHYKNVAPGFNMGDKTAFYYGYDNSNDGSYRSLPNISTPENFYQNYSGPNHNQWVQNNGPFKIYMQNLTVPEINDWKTYGMNATVYASDQSYWGFGDAPQPNGLNSRIRALLGIDSKCLVALWTTTGINIFHQACTGQALGVSIRTIMNHNSGNQYLEKPPQQYDTQDWWNRTHFAYLGDPTLNLYQIAPPSNIQISSDLNNSAVLHWSDSPDPDVIGYHIFESNSEFGAYTRITNSPVVGNSFMIPDYQYQNWYMVKAIKSITSGCGKFLHSSLGKEIQGNIVLNIENETSNRAQIHVYPNPAGQFIQIQSSIDLNHLCLYSTLGKKVLDVTIENATNYPVDLSELSSGIYTLQLFGSNSTLVFTSKIVKN